MASMEKNENYKVRTILCIDNERHDKYWAIHDLLEKEKSTNWELRKGLMEFALQILESIEEVEKKYRQ